MPIPGKGPLRTAIDDFLKTSGIGKLVRGWLTSALEMLEGSIAGEYKKEFDKLNTQQGLEGLFDVAKMTSGLGAHQGSIFSALGFANSLGSSAASTLFGPYFRLINYEIDRNLHTTRLDPSASIAGFWRDAEHKELYEGDLGALGWSAERVEILTKLIRPRLSQTELANLVLRGKLSEGDFVAEMSARGYLPGDIEGMKELFHIIPSPNDLISMAVREAWNDSVSARFKYDEELPSEAASEAAKQGLDPIWFKRFWRAHWQLISPTQGMEMLHRLRPGLTDVPFTLDDMRTLLKTADYPEFFRDRLIETSYSPLTRVDVRRMYGEGVLTKEQVKNAYMDIGYNEENANLLMEFTVKYESRDEDTVSGKKKKLSKERFIRGYVSGIIDETELRTKLASVPLSQDDIDFEVSLAKLDKMSGASVNYPIEYNRDLKALVEKEYASRFIDKPTATQLLSSIGMSGNDIEACLKVTDYKHNAMVIDEVLANIKDGYITGQIDYQNAVSMMGKISLSGASQDTFITEWNMLKEIRTKPLTEAQYRTALKQGIYTLAEYKSALKGLGYSDEAVRVLTAMQSTKAESEVQ